MKIYIKKKISFYNLLNLIKKNKNPYKVKLYLNQKTANYIYDLESNCYVLENQNDANYIFYDFLNETLTDKQMLEDIIEIEDNYLSSKFRR